MEKALFITNVENLKFYRDNIKRIYFGIEFCEHLIPEYLEFEKAYYFSESKKIGFTMVTPYVSNLGLEKLYLIFEKMEKINNKIEIVVNDWGVLNLINKNFSFKELVLGRLLNKMKRDFRLTHPRCDFPRGMMEYFQDSNVSLPHYRDFLIKKNIKRLEFDNLFHGFNLNLSEEPVLLQNSIYYPYMYVTTTRLCKFSQLQNTIKNNDSRMVLFPVKSCPKPCKNYIVSLKPVDFDGVTLFQKGNTIFIANKNRHMSLQKHGINRLVFQPTIPL